MLQNTDLAEMSVWKTIQKKFLSVRVTEDYNRMCYAPASYSTGPWFTSRPGDKKVDSTDRAL
jgi:hypothetical protein